MKTVEYLDAVKDYFGISSDYELAKRLDVSTATLSNYRNGKRAFDNTMAARIVQILPTIKLHEIIADMEIERASTPAQRRFWERIRDAAVVAIVTIGAASFGLAPSPAQAAISHNQNPQHHPLGHNATGITIAALWRALARWLRGWL